jgi:heme/copper-type cytochrome/quinol oxidase subunit 2
MLIFSNRILRIVVAAIILGAAGLVSVAHAQQATEIQITHKDKKFQPTEISAPADTPIVLRVKNQDAKAIEFESKTLRVEKVIAANGEATINVRPQKAGRYEFFDEFNEKNARGALVVK